MLALVILLMLAQAPASLTQKYQLAQEHMAAERYREAIPLIAELVKATPGDAVLLLNLGMAQFMAGDSPAAEENLKRAAEFDSSLFPANLFLGLARMNLGQTKSAIPPLRKALELQPDQAQVPGAGRCAIPNGRLRRSGRRVRQTDGTRPIKYLRLALTRANPHGACGPRLCGIGR